MEDRVVGASPHYKGARWLSNAGMQAVDKWQEGPGRGDVAPNKHIKMRALDFSTWRDPTVDAIMQNGDARPLRNAGMRDCATWQQARPVMT